MKKETLDHIYKSTKCPGRIAGATLVVAGIALIAQGAGVAQGAAFSSIGAVGLAVDRIASRNNLHQPKQK